MMFSSCIKSIFYRQFFKMTVSQARSKRQLFKCWPSFLRVGYIFQVSKCFINIVNDIQRMITQAIKSRVNFKHTPKNLITLHKNDTRDFRIKLIIAYICAHVNGSPLFFYTQNFTNMQINK